MNGSTAFQLLAELFPGFNFPVPAKLRFNEPQDIRLKATGLELIQRSQANKPTVLPIQMTLTASVHGRFIVTSVKIKIIAAGNDGHEFSKWISTDTKNVIQPSVTTTIAA